jgi:heavy metal translocating P-type ATPase
MSACCDDSARTLPLKEDSPETLARPQSWLRFAIALVLAGLSMQFSLGVNLSPVGGPTRLLVHGGLAAAAILVLVLLGGPIFRRSLGAARAGRVTLEQLFLLGIAGALAASLHSSLTGAGAIYYEVVGVLVAVYTLGQMLVARQRSRVRTSLHRLTDSLRTATRVTCCGKRSAVPISQLEAGDRVLVEKGHRIPVDGTISEGRAYVQEIAHTGEPFPASKAPGDTVLGGTVALDGELIIEVHDPSAGRELDRLAQRLDHALRQRSAWQREADRWMTWFVPGVIFLAAGTLVFWLWHTGWQQALFNALAVLLVACPCGLGLGVPIALWHGMQQLARLGIVPAGGELIERLARVRTVVFDKTGTLTDDEIQLSALLTLDDIDASALRARLALIEAHSDHPVARPFTATLGKEAQRSEHRLLKVNGLPGQGVVARLSCNSHDEVEVRIGNRTLLLPQHDRALEQLRRRQVGDAGLTRELFIFEDNSLVAIALLRENVRPTVATLAPRLRALGLRTRIMTGDASSSDSQWTVAGLRVTSGMTTADKGAAVRALETKNEHVLFVGDGMNDSEAMAAATASLVLHGGDATARAHAHGELTGAALSALPEAVSLSRATRRQIRLILGISLAYNAVGLLLAATGWLHPVAAAVIMFASSLTVVGLAGRSLAVGSSPLEFSPEAGPTAALPPPSLSLHETGERFGVTHQAVRAHEKGDNDLRCGAEPQRPEDRRTPALDGRFRRTGIA